MDEVVVLVMMTFVSMLAIGAGVIWQCVKRG